jgi:hypothetical protein
MSKMAGCFGTKRPGVSRTIVSPGADLRRPNRLARFSRASNQVPQCNAVGNSGRKGTLLRQAQGILRGVEVAV